MTSEPIDAVITWVDGGDPAHRRKLDAYLAGLGRARPRTADPTRFSDDGELEWCLASIVRFAPWFRTVYIVSDGQRPALLDGLRGTPWESRVRLVDHRPLFAGFEHHLPTFNSRSIITMLWRIPGLAERFVYFNDDFFLLRALAPTDFFRGESVVQRGGWRPQSRFRWDKRLARMLGRDARDSDDAAGNHVAQELSARIAGFERDYFRLYHNPFPFRVSTMAAFFDANPGLLDANASHRLRSAKQFKGESLATHLAFAQGQAVIDGDLRVVQLKPAEQAAWRLRRKLRQADGDARVAFGCVQSLEKADPAVRTAIVQWLDARIGRLRDALAPAHP
ncbi:MAG: capsular biosynthesis protein [Lysobacteraceae bacterium]|nr:MAG: capsular biosynthesis protein [Xanthomonadaceae bacterium]